MTFTIKDALREAVTAHHDGTKLLERSVLGVYKMKNLSQLLATDEGEDKVIQRLQVIDMARNIINSMAIDNDGEDYQYINASMSGASDIIDRTCNMLSAVTDIQQTILFGKDPAGEEATGDNDRDNYFQLLNRIQTNSYKNASAKVVKLVLKAMVADGTQEKDIPQYEVRFNPMKQLSEEEQANIDSIKAGTAQTKAATAQVYVDMQALDPSEVRKGLADSNDYQIQGIVENDNLEIPEEAYDLRKQFAELNQIGGEGEDNGNASVEEGMQQAADNPAEDGMMNADGAPFRNRNAAGPHDGRSSQKDYKAARLFTKAVKGTVAQNGVTVNEVSAHAGYRMKSRNITPEDLKDSLTNPDFMYPGNGKHKDVTCFQKGKNRIVLSNTGNVVTTIDLWAEDD